MASFYSKNIKKIYKFFNLDQFNSMIHSMDRQHIKNINEYFLSLNMYHSLCSYSKTKLFASLYINM